MANTSANSGRLLSKLRSYPYWIQFALVAATYYLSRSLFMFQIKQGSFAGAFIYAPIGLGLAALLILGYRIWPAIAVGAFFVHLEGMNRLPFALSSMTSNTLEALLSAYLLQRFTAFDLRLQRRKDVLGFVGLSVVLATAICATIGAVLYCLAGVVPWRRFENFWFLWWRADAMGTLIVAPLILVWSTRQPRTELRRMEKQAYWRLRLYSPAISFLSDGLDPRKPMRLCPISYSRSSSGQLYAWDNAAQSQCWQRCCCSQPTER